MLDGWLCPMAKLGKTVTPRGRKLALLSPPLTGENVFSDVRLWLVRRLSWRCETSFFIYLLAGLER